MKSLLRALCALSVVILLNLLFGGNAKNPGTKSSDPQAAPVQKPGAKAPNQPTDVVLGENLAKWRSRIERANPDLVLIGNSTLTVNVDDSAFSTLTKVKTESIGSPGAASAWSYLVFKNVICQATPKPKMVGIFFRDHFLTDPAFRVRGFHYGKELKKVSLAEEPLLDRLAYLGRLTPVDFLLMKHLPLYRQKDVIKKATETRFKDGAAGLVAHAPAGAVDRAIQNTFGGDKIKREELTLVQQTSEEIVEEARYRFDDEVKTSFLPAIIELARANNIQLYFIRIKSRRDLENHPEPAKLTEYLGKLRSYLSKQGIPLIDMSHAQGLNLSHRADGDHFTRDGRLIYTRMVAEHFIAMRERQRQTPERLTEPLEVGRDLFVWAGSSTSPVSAAMAEGTPDSKGRVRYRIPCYFESPGNYELSLAMGAGDQLTSASMGGRPLIVQPAPGLLTDAAFRGRQSAIRAACVAAAPGEGMVPLVLDFARRGPTPPMIRLAYSGGPWIPVSSSFDLGEPVVWERADAFRMGVPLRIQRATYPSQAASFFLVQMGGQGGSSSPQVIYKWDHLYQYVLGRQLKSGDIVWAGKVEIPQKMARQYLNRTLMLGVVPLYFPGGNGASYREPLLSPPEYRGSLGLHRVCYLRFVEKDGKVILGLGTTN